MIFVDKMRYIALLLFGCFIAQINEAKAQNAFAAAEDSLKIIGRTMVLDSLAQHRFDANQAFVIHLVRALETKNSFQYPFDSLNMISRLYAPDNSFRLLTWQIEKDENYARQYGALQMNTADGSLKLFPLFDVSEFTENPEDSARDNRHWIGALYYKIILTVYRGQKFYTLLGLDDNNVLTTKKWIEVLTLDKAGNPVFGGDYFDYKEDFTKPKPPVDRFCIEFKKDARARLNYDEERQMILFDHLISEDNKPWEKMTLIPDGDYEGFEWKDGKWRQIEKVFNQKLYDGQAPLPHPVEKN